MSKKYTVTLTADEQARLREIIYGHPCVYRVLFLPMPLVLDYAVSDVFHSGQRSY